MADNPRISILIPTYNRRKLVINAIRSALAQTYRDYEIVVVDDGSSDGTAEAIAALIAEPATGDRVPDIRYFFQRNAGQSAARNKAIELSRGEWLAFLDSDDLWVPEKLERQVRAVARFTHCGACFTDATLVDGDGRRIGAFEEAGHLYEEREGVIPHPARTLAINHGGMWMQTLLLRRDIVLQVGGLDPQIRYVDDYDLFFRLALVTEFCQVGERLAILNRANNAHNPDIAPRPWDDVEFRLRDEIAMREKWLTLSPRYSSEIHAIIVSRLRELHSTWSNLHLKTGAYGLAREQLQAAIRYGITAPLLVKWTLARLAPRIAAMMVEAPTAPP